MLALTVSGPAQAGPLEDLLRRAAESALQKATVPSAPAPAPRPADAPPPATSPPPPAAHAAPAAPAAPAVSALAYVAPQAVVRVASVPQRLALDGATWGRKFSAESGGPQVLLSNPYLDPARLTLAAPRHLQCLQDGRVLVGGESGFDAVARRTVGIGYWQLAPDGAMTPRLTRSTQAGGRTARTQCDAPYDQTRLPALRPAVMDDGSLVVARDMVLIRLRADGQAERLAGSPKACEPDNSPGLAGFADGAADEARFRDLQRVVAGADGQVWSVDQGGCALRLTAPDGGTRTVLGPDQLCAAAVPPTERVTLGHMAWDRGRGELVTGGDVLTPNQLYTTVWRVRPDGGRQRVLLGHKLGQSPAGAQLDGISALALDAQGRIVIASRRMANDQLALLRVDEGRRVVVPLTGMAVKAGSSMAGTLIDGPAAQARFTAIKDLCVAPDGVAYVLDDLLVRRLDATGQVTTWGY